MTSRSSFFKLMKEDLRQRLWTIVLAAIVFLLPVPIYIAMQLSKYSGIVTNLVRRLTSPLEADSLWLVLVTVCGALICAVSGFGYLFSKRKVDFFHSLPVKREKLFAVRYINGVLIYLVPYLLMLLISSIIIAFSGELSGDVMWRLAEGCIVHVMGYLTVYTVLILCVTFVGNIVVFFAVSGWTFGITAVAVAIYGWFESGFFDTFSNYQDVAGERLHDLRFLCPEYFYISAVEHPEPGLLLQQFIFTLVLIIITLAVYKVRPSEGAGKAIAFSVLKPVIRISIEVLAGAMVGMMFYEMADSDKGVPGWMLLGVVLGVVLSHMLIQSIFYFDVRKCFAGKVSMGVCVVAAAVFTLVMRYDVFGYDRYIPKKHQIESVAIAVNGLDEYGNNYVYRNNQVEWAQEIHEMELTDVDGAYPYLKVLVEDSDTYFESRRNDIWPDGYLAVDVAYHLKNGKTIYRSYRSDGIREELFAPVFETQEYKEGHYSDIYTVPSELLDSVTACYAMNEQAMSLTMAEREQFMRILKNELSAQTLREKLYTLPVAIVELSFKDETDVTEYDGIREYRTRYFNSEIAIYPSFTETLHFLKERGFDPEKEYVWTGKEAMRIELPEGMYKDKEGAVAWSPEEWEKEGYYQEDAAYREVSDIAVMHGDNSIPVAPENFEKVYALCRWERLFYYSVPDYNCYDSYRVYLEVPMDGYNTHNTYCFVIPREEDLSFLFEK